MCILSFEIEQIALDILDHNIRIQFSNCDLKSLLQLCLVSKCFHKRFYPTLQEITANPLRWAINHKHETLFRRWLDTVNTYLYTQNRERNELNWATQNLEANVRCNTIEEIKNCCCKRIFKLAGECGVSIDFVKVLWMTLCKNGFKKPSLCEYFSNLKNEKRIDKTCLREDLLKDNSAYNVLYHMEWNNMRTRA